MTHLLDRPPIDERVFASLIEELGDDGACATFAQMYLDSFPGRLSELSHALNGGEARPWEAAMNLAAVSRMLGALPVAQHLERLRRDSIITESAEARAVYLRQLVALARQLQPALRQRIRALAAPTHPVYVGGSRRSWR